MNVLVVEDEHRVADFIVRGLSSEGWSVEHAETGEEALDLVINHEFDIVLLDLMLPGLSGQEVTRRLRARGNHTPILMLTALDSTSERVNGLGAGADDYLVKPFDFDELIARVSALVRRHQEFNLDKSSQVLEFDQLRLDVRSLVLTIDDQEVELTARERDLLMLFMGNPGKVFARERILNTVWRSQEDPLTNVVDVYVGRLRKKLGRYGKQIKTVRGLGYRFV